MTKQCSFCGKSQDAVRKLISSPQERSNTYICDECVSVCVEILNKDDQRPPLAPDAKPPKTIPLWLARMFGERKSD